MSTEQPFFSCIICAYNEGRLLNLSLDSMVRQSFKDFEVIVVDDGADDATKAAIAEIDDPRFRVITQANDGLSSARNRGIRHAKGRYICFLDGDDTRPIWALQEVYDALQVSEADVAFGRGSLCDLRGEITHFYDDEIIQHLIEKRQSNWPCRSEDPDFNELTSYTMLLEPQSANKFVSAKLVRDFSLSFPNGHFFEDIFFHCAVVSSMSSFCVVGDICFTYYRRYGRPQITGSTNDSRFGALAVARMTFDIFRRSPRYHNTLLREALVIAIFRIISWCKDSISHTHRFQYHEAIIYLISMIDPGYLQLDYENSRFYRSYHQTVAKIQSMKGEIKERLMQSDACT
ncbi:MULTISPECIES: glycosyltransferase family 2 protein [Methylobacterium]|uniref:glycosyltransferase family 2 protein n=1 Tax=Methylobacterium TaxID=407 RepID=UPI0013EA3BA3|nr:glycosyltransferase family A protein [Methylobacterium sp. DB0501]NGM37067.1 glycosyltransferase family 2 protein [Methylobacterium sp. DB0501]